MSCQQADHGMVVASAIVIAIMAVVYGAVAFDRLFICRSRAVVEETSKAVLAFEDEVVCQKLGMNNPQWEKNKHGRTFSCQKNGVSVKVERKL